MESESDDGGMQYDDDGTALLHGLHFLGKERLRIFKGLGLIKLLVFQS
jgi:hypothetical protein